MTTYSNRKVPNDPSVFPEPQTWLTWIEERRWEWDSARREYAPVPGSGGDGKVRYYHSLPDAKKGMRWVGSASRYRSEDERGVFTTNWAVYNWNGQEWVKVYEGFEGERRDDNPLFKLRFKKGEKVHAIDQKLEEAAIASILGTGQ